MKLLTKKRLLGMILAMFALAAPASAAAGDLVGELRLVSAHATDGSVDPLTDDDQFTMVSLGAGWGFEEVLPGLRGYVTYTAGGLTNTRLASELTWNWSRSMFLAEADWGPTLFTFLRPWARLGAGYVVHTLELDTEASPAIYDYAHDLAVKPSLGFDVFLPFEWSTRAIPFTVGLSTEFGYLWMTTATYDELRYEDEAFVPEDEEDPYTRETPDLGDMNTNGFFWNLGLQARLRF